MSSKDTYSKILKSSVRLFAEHGYDRVTIKHICEDANVSLSAVHYHFNSKEELYSKIINSLDFSRMETAQKFLTMNFSSVDDMQERLHFFAKELSDIVISSQCILQIIFDDISKNINDSLKIFTEKITPVRNSIVGFLETAIKQKLVREDIDPVMVSDLIVYHICNEMQWSIFKKVAPVTTSDLERQRLEWTSRLISLIIHGAKESYSRPD